jgi:NAD(P)-dependent dehydrogenase (short-subunit alcohol dehydrogenase family)
MVIASKGAVVVTGASTGIGKTCVLHLDKLGFQVFAGVRKEADGDALKREASTPASQLSANRRVRMGCWI